MNQSDNSVFELYSGLNAKMCHFSPLDALFAEYRKDKADIERISAFVQNETGVMSHFVSGMMAQSNYNSNSVSIHHLFNAKNAIKSLDAEFWSRAMSLTDVLDTMDAGKRNEWATQIHKHETPEFEQVSVVNTIQSMLAQRSHFLAQRVDGLFKNLSGEHITNSPAGFSKRMIIDFISHDGYLNNRQAEYIHDLRCVIAKFSGRDTPKTFVTNGDLQRILKEEAFGDWHAFDGGSWNIKLFKKGTAHMEIHPEMAWKLNAILATLYPMAIPETFRRKPVKAEKSKEYPLQHDLVSFEVIETIRSGRLNNEGTQLYFDKPIAKKTTEVLSRIGGVPNGVSNWLFDYDVHSVLNALFRMGSLPEQRSHQFYATPESISKRVIDWAEIEIEHKIIEPSAGQGGLVDKLPNKNNVKCIDISQLHCDILRAKGYNDVHCGDFLVWNRDRFGIRDHFDRIIMNPPFSESRALTHLKHAASMLNSAGILVAVLPCSLKGKTIVEGVEHEWSETITGAFDDTGVSVVLLKLTKENKT
jgi:hypothetical protein